jgi:spermidine synthase
LGLGGGIITQKLYEKGYQHIEACELDKYIYEAAVKYFGFSEKIKVSIDDARHYINLLQHNYDILIIDVFKGEEPASHVITLQSLEKIKKHLNNNALLVFNTAGYLESNLGKGNKSLINTLQHAGFKVAIMPQGYNINIEDQRNLLVIASLSEAKIVEAKKYFTEKEINLNNIDLASAAILSDEIPNTEKLFAASAMQWRRLNFKYALIMFDN